MPNNDFFFTVSSSIDLYQTMDDYVVRLGIGLIFEGGHEKWTASRAPRVEPPDSQAKVVILAGLRLKYPECGEGMVLRTQGYPVAGWKGAGQNGGNLLEREGRRV